MKTTTRIPQGLDPTREAKHFDTRHISAVQEPGNQREFLLIQDNSTMELAESLTNLLGILTPCLDYIKPEISNAALEVRDYISEKLADTNGMEQVTARAAEIAALQVYPDQAHLVNILDDMAKVPELDAATTELRSWFEQWTPEAWPMNEDAIYVPCTVARAKCSERSDLATFVAALEGKDGSGVLVTRDGPIWETITERHDPVIAETTTVPAEVNPEPTVSTPESPVAQAAVEVNPESAVGTGVFAEVRGVFDEMLEAIAVPTLNQVQRMGVARHYIEELAASLETVIDRGFPEPESESPASENAGIDRNMLRSLIEEAVQEATMPLQAEVETLRRALGDQAVAPVRRSLTSVPRGTREEQLPDLGVGGYKTATASQLARRGLY